MTCSRPMASLSLDLDNKWSYLKTHGDPRWATWPSYLDVVVPRVLKFLEERDLTITIFVVGQDAVFKQNHELLQAIVAAGHEIGNHSFCHEPWLHLYSASQIEQEVIRAEEAIVQATGRKPGGFRGPGFSLTRPLLEVLAGRGYCYDASTFPTFLMPLARTYYLMTARLSREERRQRRSLGGTIWGGFRSLKPYRWRLEQGTLVEMPVTTLPLLKLPIHMSYVLCLALYAPALALRYFDWSMRWCRWAGVQPSLLLHPTDFLGSDDTQDLAFFPGMSLPSQQKLDLVSAVLKIYTERFEVLTLEQHAYAVARRSYLPLVDARFHYPDQPGEPEETTVEAGRCA